MPPHYRVIVAKRSTLNTQISSEWGTGEVGAGRDNIIASCREDRNVNERDGEIGRHREIVRGRELYGDEWGRDVN